MNLLAIAGKYRRLGDYQSAIKTYKKIYNSKQKKYIKHKSFCALAIADSLRVLGKFQEARRYYREASLWAKKDSGTNWLDCRIGMALCDKASGNYKTALLKLNKLLVVAKKLNDSHAIGFILWNIGMLYRFMGLLGKSKKFLETSCKIFKNLNDTESQGFSLCGLAGCLRASGEIEKSLSYYQRANRLFKKNDDAYGLAYSYCGMANAYKAKGRIKDAVFYYGKSELLYRKIKDLSSLAFVYKGLFGCYAITGCDILKDFYFQKALQLFKKSGDTRGLVSLFLEKLSHNYDPRTYAKALKISLRHDLKTELKYLKNYNIIRPQKWLS